MILVVANACFCVHALADSFVPTDSVNVGFFLAITVNAGFVPFANFSFVLCQRLLMLAMYLLIACVYIFTAMFPGLSWAHLRLWPRKGS